MVESYYDILGIDKSADTSEIKKAYRKLALEHHPDKGGKEEQFKKVQAAYHCLIDDDERTQYDLTSDNSFDTMPENVMQFFKSHLENNFFDSFGRSFPQSIPTTEISLSISLIDVCCGGEKKVDFERLAFIDATGNIINQPHNATKTCGLCQGTGNQICVHNNGFFIQQIVSPCDMCSGKGYVLINGCKLVKRKCRFRHNLPIGTLDKEEFLFEHDGDILYNKNTKSFYKGHVVIIVNYNIPETNKTLFSIFEFPGISITKTKFGDIHYEYNASVFEFITGTKFNIPLANKQFLLLNVDILNQPKTIKKYGLPQITNKKNGTYELRNIIITFKMKPINPNFSITDNNRLLLKNMFPLEYPQVIEQYFNVDNYT